MFEYSRRWLASEGVPITIPNTVICQRGRRAAGTPHLIFRLAEEVLGAKIALFRCVWVWVVGVGVCAYVLFRLAEEVLGVKIATLRCVCVCVCDPHHALTHTHKTFIYPHVFTSGESVAQEAVISASPLRVSYHA